MFRLCSEGFRHINGVRFAYEDKSLQIHQLRIITQLEGDTITINTKELYAKVELCIIIKVLVISPNWVSLGHFSVMLCSAVRSQAWNRELCGCV